MSADHATGTARSEHSAQRAALPPALVLAAGHGSRLRPLTAIPKPLAEFRGRRLIEWSLLWLADSGVRRVWVNLHNQPEAFVAALGDGTRYELELQYSREPEILGTAGGWLRLRPEWTSTSLVIYGDNVMRFDLHALLEAHRRGGTAATIALFDPERHANTGIAGGRVVLGEGGRVVDFREGPDAGATGLVNAGAYVLEPAVAETVGTGFQDFGRDVLPALAAARELRGHVIEPGGFCLGLDTPAHFAIADGLVREGIARL